MIFFKQQLNIDDAKARVFAEEIEKIVDSKFDTEKDKFASLNAVEKIDHKLDVFIEQIKTAIAQSEVRMAERVNRQIIWLIATMFTLSGLILALIKAFF